VPHEPGRIGTDLQHAPQYGPDSTPDCLHATVAEALNTALGEAADAFRVSLTPDQAKVQVVGGAQTVA
jgi:hypothetical protein